VLNALAAIAVARHLEVGIGAIQTGLREFAGIGRRFESVGEIPAGTGSALVVDDYAHHPREIAATLEAARRAWPERRLVVVFQPHRFTRTQDLLDDFAAVLADVEVLLITEVYAAGEPRLDGADGRALCRAVRSRGRIEPVFVPELDDLSPVLADLLAEGDVLLTLGAGSIGRAARELVRGKEA
jgi:UDP-N-acetylmuramate--alanine ligase